MAAFLTVTLNPALDLSTAVEQIVDAHKLRCEAPAVHPGGGGINVARVLHRLGQRVQAAYTVGGATGERLSRLVVAEQVPSAYLPIAGETRESFTVRETRSGREFRFVLPGPTLTPGEWAAALAHLRALPGPIDYLVASGSLPPGVPDDAYAQLARLARERGARMVVDSSGAALAQALQAGVWLVKPSQRELATLVGHPLDTLQARQEAAQSLVASGQAEAVALSLGSEGALLATAEGVLRARALDVPVVGTVGAGDSFLASLLWAHAEGGSWADALRAALAGGAAALAAPGTALAQADAIRALRPQVRLD